MLCRIAIASDVDSLKYALKNERDLKKQVEILHNLFYINEFTDTSAALQYALKAYQISKDQNFNKELIVSLICLGYYCEDHSRYAKAISYYKQALEIAEKIKDNDNAAACYKNFANVYLQQGNYPEAIKNYQKALKIADETNNNDLKAKCLANIGSVYLYQNNLDKAIENYKKAILLYEKFNDTKRLANCLNNLGLAYKMNNQPDSAMVSFNRAENMLIEIDDRRGLADCYHNIATIYASEQDSNLTDYNMALEIYNKSFHIYSQLGDKKGVALCMNSIGLLMYKLEKYYESIDYAKQSLEIAKEIESKDEMKNAYKTIASSYAALNDYKQAYNYFEKYSEAKDSLYIEKSIQLQAELEARYENEKKQKEIELKNIELAKKDAIVKQKTTVQYALVTGIALIIVILFVLYQSYRNKKQANLLLSKQKLEIEEKNKDIMNSIKYAKRIQESILMHESDIRGILPASFVLYKPKDIVSGDFYWISPKENKVLFAVVDCTGHGVPGAFISIIANNGLNKTVNEFGLVKPSDILNNLNDIINSTIKQTYKESTISDGLDISLCSLDKNTLSLDFSGAHHPLYIIRNNEIIEIKGDKRPVGHFIEYNYPDFKNRSIQLQKGDVIYLFSDGYPDQFGGPENKKFKYKKFKNILLTIHKKSPEEQKTELNNVITEWMDGMEQIDDICIFGVKV
ncbi:MAG: hypothetical protein Kow0068_21980 [Marinilabiliales bacterium]